MPIYFQKYKKAFVRTSDFIHNVENYQIDRSLHERMAERAVENFKMQMAEEVSEVYCPGTM